VTFAAGNAPTGGAEADAVSASPQARTLRSHRLRALRQADPAGRHGGADPGRRVVWSWQDPFSVGGTSCPCATQPDETW